MLISTVIATIGRHSLIRAIESVINQNVDQFKFEVIVVNDSELSLNEEKWQHASQVRIVNTNRRERSVARNTGAAIAKGKYLHFLDDDDWLISDAWSRLGYLAQVTEAGWLYGGTQLLDRDNNPTIKLTHQLIGNCFVQAMAGEWVPLQASLINADLFHQVGGFNPHLSGPEDIDLFRRLSLKTDVAGIDELVAYVSIGEQGSSTDYSKHPVMSRWAREAILDESGAFRRMRSGAHNPYWQGRVTRAYFTSAVWNIQNRRLFKSSSRFLFCIMATILTGQDLFSHKFWRAVLHPYESETFERGLLESVAESRKELEFGDQSRLTLLDSNVDRG